MRYSVQFVLLAAGVAIAAESASAPFKLLEPASWLIENDLGHPQKTGPGGYSYDHCANLRITTDPKPLDKGWPAERQ
jgi:hypothetical protein